MGGKKILMPGGEGGTYAIYLTAQIQFSLAFMFPTQFNLM
jgi:hypothetical protein